MITIQDEGMKNLEDLRVLLNLDSRSPTLTKQALDTLKELWMKTYETGMASLFNPHQLSDKILKALEILKMEGNNLYQNDKIKESFSVYTSLCAIHRGFSRKYESFKRPGDELVIAKIVSNLSQAQNKLDQTEASLQSSRDVLRILKMSTVLEANSLRIKSYNRIMNIYKKNGLWLEAREIAKEAMSLNCEEDKFKTAFHSFDEKFNSYPRNKRFDRLRLQLAKEPVIIIEQRKILIDRLQELRRTPVHINALTLRDPLYCEILMAAFHNVKNALSLLKFSIDLWEAIRAEIPDSKDDANDEMTSMLLMSAVLESKTSVDMVKVKEAVKLACSKGGDALSLIYKADIFERFLIIPTIDKWLPVMQNHCQEYIWNQIYFKESEITSLYLLDTQHLSDHLKSAESRRDKSEIIALFTKIYVYLSQMTTMDNVDGIIACLESNAVPLLLEKLLISRLRVLCRSHGKTSQKRKTEYREMFRKTIREINDELEVIMDDDNVPSNLAYLLLNRLVIYMVWRAGHEIHESVISVRDFAYHMTERSLLHEAVNCRDLQLVEEALSQILEEYRDRGKQALISDLKRLPIDKDKRNVLETLFDGIDFSYADDDSTVSRDLSQERGDIDIKKRSNKKKKKKKKKAETALAIKSAEDLKIELLQPPNWNNELENYLRTDPTGGLDELYLDLELSTDSDNNKEEEGNGAAATSTVHAEYFPRAAPIKRLQQNTSGSSSSDLANVSDNRFALLMKTASNVAQEPMKLEAPASPPDGENNTSETVLTTTQSTYHNSNHNSGKEDNSKKETPPALNDPTQKVNPTTNQGQPDTQNTLPPTATTEGWRPASKQQNQSKTTIKTANCAATAVLSNGDHPSDTLGSQQDDFSEGEIVKASFRSLVPEKFSRCYDASMCCEECVNLDTPIKSHGDFCRRDILVVTTRSGPKVRSTIRDVMIPEFKGKYQLCYNVEENGCHPRCTYVHNEAERDFWEAERSGMFKIKKLRKSLREIYGDKTDQKEIKSNKGKKKGTTPDTVSNFAPITTNNPITPHHNTNMAAVSKEPPTPSTMLTFIHPNNQNTNNQISHPSEQTPTLHSGQMATGNGVRVPVPGTSFIKEDTHVFKLVCMDCIEHSKLPGRCTVKSNHHETVGTLCAETVLIVQNRKTPGSYEWIRIRERPLRNFHGNHVMCAHMLKLSSCWIKDGCSFAHTEEERDLWDEDKSGNFGITEFIDRNSQGAQRASKEGVRHVADWLSNKWGGAFVKICGVCFSNNKTTILPTGSNDKQICNNKVTDEHICDPIVLHCSNPAGPKGDPKIDGRSTTSRLFLTHTVRGGVDCDFFPRCNNLDNCLRAHTILEREIMLLCRVLAANGGNDYSIIDNLLEPHRRQSVTSGGATGGHPTTQQTMVSPPITPQHPVSHHPNTQSTMTYNKAVRSSVSSAGGSTHSSITSTDNSGPPALNSVSKQQVFGFPIVAYCALCQDRKGQLNPQGGIDSEVCSGKDRHKWIKPIFMRVSNSSKAERIRNPWRKLDTYTPCYNKKAGSKCQRGDACHHAHSDVELQVWNWMGNKKIFDLEKVLKEYHCPGNITAIQSANPPTTTTAPTLTPIPATVSTITTKPIEHSSTGLPGLTTLTQPRENSPVWTPLSFSAVSQQPKIPTAAPGNLGAVPSHFSIPKESILQTQNPYVCDPCGKTLYGTRQWEEHCDSWVHKNNTQLDGDGWSYRSPIAMGGQPRELKMCPSHKNNESCEFSNSTLQQNRCSFAHSIEELDEWKERLDCRKMKKAMEKEVEFNDLIKLFGQAFENDKESAIAKDIPNVSIMSNYELHINIDKKEANRQWIFTVHSKVFQLVKVFLFKDHHRHHFHLSIPGYANEDTTYGQLLSSGRHFNPDDVHSGLSIQLEFRSKVHGQFKQWIIFDFGTRTLVHREVIVESASPLVLRSIYMQRHDLVPSDERWIEDDNVDLIRYAEPECVLESDIIKRYPQYATHDAVTEISLLPLSHENYVQKMHNLLATEELYRQKQISNYNLQVQLELVDFIQVVHHYIRAPPGQLFARVDLQESLCDDTEAGHLLLTSVRSAWILPADTSTFWHDSNSRRKVYETLVVDAERFNVTARGRDHLYLCLSRQCVNEMEYSAGSKPICEVQFQPSRSFFCTLHHALDSIPKTREGRPIVYPNINLPRHQIDCPDYVDQSILNNDQFNIVKSVLAKHQDSTSPLPVVVCGCFGAGKTETLARTIIELLRLNPESRILLCAHNNISADQYITKYFDKFKVPNVVRLYYKNRAVVTAHPDWNIMKNYALLTPDQTRYRGVTDKDMRKARVMVTTLTTSLELSNVKGIDPGFYNYIFIDEAAQVMEAEILIPIMMADSETRLVLAGDPMQMSPEVFCLKAGSAGLNTTLLGRLWNYYLQLDHQGSPQTNIKHRFLLSTVYRTCPQIVEFLSLVFYGGPRVLSSKAEDVVPAGWTQLSIYSVYNSAPYSSAMGEERDENLTSWLNLAEANQVVLQVERLYRDWPDNWGPRDQSQICVVTPSFSQMKVIRQEMRHRHLHAVAVERMAGILNQVQGREFRAVFISPVRTRNLFFDDDSDFSHSSIHENNFHTSDRLINTALTRAKSLVQVVGDPLGLVLCGTCQQIWRQYIVCCSSHQLGLQPPEAGLSLDAIVLLENKLVAEKERRRIMAVQPQPVLHHYQQMVPPRQSLSINPDDFTPPITISATTLTPSAPEFTPRFKPPSVTPLNTDTVMTTFITASATSLEQHQQSSIVDNYQTVHTATNIWSLSAAEQVELESDSFNPNEESPDDEEEEEETSSGSSGSETSSFDEEEYGSSSFDSEIYDIDQRSTKDVINHFSKLENINFPLFTVIFLDDKAYLVKIDGNTMITNHRMEWHTKDDISQKGLKENENYTSGILERVASTGETFLFKDDPKATPSRLKILPANNTEILGFPGDRVLVKIDYSTVPIHGVICGIINQFGGKLLRSQSIVCRVDPKNYSRFYPLDPTLPPMYSIIPYNRRLLLKLGVIVYSLEKLLTRTNPRVYLFLFRYVSIHKSSGRPIGFITKVLEDNNQFETPMFRSGFRVTQLPNIITPNQSSYTDRHDYTQVDTYSLRASKNSAGVDFAFSLTNENDLLSSPSIILHILDVSRIIQDQSEVKEEISLRGMGVSSNKNRPRIPLYEKRYEDDWSFNRETPQPAISLHLRVTLQNIDRHPIRAGGIRGTGRVMCSLVGIKPSLVLLQHGAKTYHELDRHLRDLHNDPDKDNSQDIWAFFKDTALDWLWNEFGWSWLQTALEESDDCSIGRLVDCTLRRVADSFIKKYLLDHYEMCPVMGPKVVNQSDLELWRLANESVAESHISLNNWFAPNDEFLCKCTLGEKCSCLKTTTLAFSVFVTEHCFPQLAHAIQKRSAQTLLPLVTNVNVTPALLLTTYSLNLLQSPISVWMEKNRNKAKSPLVECPASRPLSRYIDLIVQNMIHHAMAMEESKKVDDLDLFIQDMEEEWELATIALHRKRQLVEYEARMSFPSNLYRVVFHSIRPDSGLHLIVCHNLSRQIFTVDLPLDKISPHTSHTDPTDSLDYANHISTPQRIVFLNNSVPESKIASSKSILHNAKPHRFCYRILPEDWMHLSTAGITSLSNGCSDRDLHDISLRSLAMPVVNPEQLTGFSRDEPCVNGEIVISLVQGAVLKASISGGSMDSLHLNTIWLADFIPICHQHVREPFLFFDAVSRRDMFDVQNKLLKSVISGSVFPVEQPNLRMVGVDINWTGNNSSLTHGSLLLPAYLTQRPYFLCPYLNRPVLSTNIFGDFLCIHLMVPPSLPVANKITKDRLFKLGPSGDSSSHSSDSEDEQQEEGEWTKMEGDVQTFFSAHCQVVSSVLDNSGLHLEISLSSVQGKLPADHSNCKYTLEWIFVSDRDRLMMEARDCAVKSESTSLIHQFLRGDMYNMKMEASRASFSQDLTRLTEVQKSFAEMALDNGYWDHWEEECSELFTSHMIYLYRQCQPNDQIICFTDTMDALNNIGSSIKQCGLKVHSIPEFPSQSTENGSSLYKKWNEIVNSSIDLVLVHTSTTSNIALPFAPPITELTRSPRIVICHLTNKEMLTGRHDVLVGLYKLYAAQPTRFLLVCPPTDFKDVVIHHNRSQ